MYVLRGRRGRLVLDARGLAIAQELESSLDVLIVGIKLGGTLVCVQSIIRLVVARLVL
jgi:hypothetical protein